MLSSSHVSRPRSGGRLFAILGLLAALAGCQTVDPVRVDSTLNATEAFATRSPADVAVLPIEDGTPDGAVNRHLVFLRQEIMRQIVDRRFTPITANVVDAALRNVPDAAVKESVLAPSSLRRVAGAAREDAVFAVRVEKWDESTLSVDKRVRFQFQAVMAGSDSHLLWSGTIQGEVKAGGVDAAPRDRDAMARSCGALAVREMLQRLPRRVL